MSSFKLLLATAPFAALVLAAALHGLAASGHFPRGAKRPAPDALVLFGSMALVVIGFAAGIVAVLRLAPWSAAIISGGLAVLVAPLALQVFPDRFVDGSGALLVFASLTVALAIALMVLVI